MVLILSKKDVMSVLTMDACMTAVEEAFRRHALGRVIMPQRSTIRISEYKALINVMPAYIRGMEALGVKLVSGYLDNPSLHGISTIQASIMLAEADTGRLVAVMEGAYITAMRTGAASGVATKYLARKDATTAGIIGAGVQARTQLAAILRSRKLSEARVYSPREENRRLFANEMRESLGIEVKPVASAREAAENVDIICTATTSKTPVVYGSWLRDGVHINGVGSHSPDARELDTATVRKAKVVVDAREAALKEAGDILIPMSQKEIPEDHIYAELGEIITGAKQGRSNDGEITLFKSQGLAIQDVSTALAVFRQAKDSGIGMDVEL